jgi:hypothetical protein
MLAQNSQGPDFNPCYNLKEKKEKSWPRVAIYIATNLNLPVMNSVVYNRLFVNPPFFLLHHYCYIFHVSITCDQPILHCFIILRTSFRLIKVKYFILHSVIPSVMLFRCLCRWNLAYYIFTIQIKFNISGMAGPMDMNSFNFSLLERIFFLLHFWRLIFLCVEFQVGEFFFFAFSSRCLCGFWWKY